MNSDNKNNFLDKTLICKIHTPPVVNSVPSINPPNIPIPPVPNKISTIPPIPSPILQAPSSIGNIPKPLPLALTIPQIPQGFNNTGGIPNAPLRPPPPNITQLNTLQIPQFQIAMNCSNDRTIPNPPGIPKPTFIPQPPGISNPPGIPKPTGISQMAGNLPKPGIPPTPSIGIGPPVPAAVESIVILYYTSFKKIKNLNQFIKKFLKILIKSLSL